jgi:hypothetical protein
VEKMISDDYLNQFYILLKNKLKRERKIKNNSVFITFLEINSTSRFRLLNEATINSNEIPKNVLNLLLDKNYIQALTSIGNYAITAKGVWYCENQLKLIDEEKLLSYINKKFFTDGQKNSQEKTTLDDKEKIILFTMISARAFSEKSSVNLKPSENKRDKWLELLEASYDFLKNFGKINKIRKEDLFKKMGNEHIASSIFRHNNRMAQKTKLIYKYTGDYEYFLDIYSNSEFSTEKMSYLFWKLFQGELSEEMIDKIIEHCNRISKNESIYLFNLSEHIFSLPCYDNKLRDSLLDSIISRSKWENIG